VWGLPSRRGTAVLAGEAARDDNDSDLNLTGLGFTFPPGHENFPDRIFVLFLSVSTERPGQYLTLGDDGGMLAYTAIFII
jgi:hypothetical protein